MRIRILDPHLRKMDPDPDPGHKNVFFNRRWIFELFLFLFFTYFSATTKKSFISFFSSSDRVLRVKYIFLQFLVNILSLDPDLWIRILLRIRIQEAKIMRIKRIRIRILYTAVGENRRRPSENYTIDKSLWDRIRTWNFELPFKEPEVGFIYLLKNRKRKSSSLLCGGDHVVWCTALHNVHKIVTTGLTNSSYHTFQRSKGVEIFFFMKILKKYLQNLYTNNFS